MISLFNIAKAAPQGSTEFSSEHNFYYYNHCYDMISSKHHSPKFTSPCRSVTSVSFTHEDKVVSGSDDRSVKVSYTLRVC